MGTCFDWDIFTNQYDMKIGNIILRLYYALGISSLLFIVNNYGQPVIITFNVVLGIAMFAALLFVIMLIEKYFFRKDVQSK